MKKMTLAVKLDYDLTERVKKFCRERGVKYGFFVEKALKEHLEREELKEDVLDLKSLRAFEEKAIPLEEYLRKKRV
jgi:predicted transcriptional regulator